ncbi:sulfatase-like hydrolase/transferase [bacterium]|jgi:hypothetical protein|nr:sulfatase-like hydrolase/transferase [bacterium]
MASKPYEFLKALYHRKSVPIFIKLCIVKFLTSYIRYRVHAKYTFPWSESGKKNLIGTSLFEDNDYAYYAQYYAESFLMDTLNHKNSNLYKYEIFKSQLYNSYESIDISFQEDSLLPVSIMDNDFINDFFPENCSINLSVNNKKYTLENIIQNRFHLMRFNKRDRCRINSTKKLLIGKPIQISKRKNKKKLVLVIFIDALGSKLFNKYPLEELMPNTYNFFKKGVIFKNCYSNAEFTTPSLASMTTGKYVHNNNFFHPGKRQIIGQKQKMINQYFHDEGFFTQLITGNPGQNPSQGYCIDYDRVIYKHSLKHQDVLMEFVDSMRVFKDRNVFTWISLFDVHHPLNIIPSFSAGSKMSIQAHDYNSGDPPLTKTTFRSYCPKTTERHVVEIEKVDYHMKSLYDFIEMNYDDEEILISLVSDHATSATIETENNSNILRKEKTNVPFMIRGSDYKNIESLEMIENVDVLPSILNSCNISIDLEKIDGILPKELGGNGKDFIFTESIYPGQTYKASIKDKSYECFLEGYALTEDDGKINLREYTIEVEDIETGNKIDNNKIIKVYLEKFRRILKTNADWG